MWLQVTFSGLASGGLYALIALAMVTIHRTTEVVNFAQGEMAMVSAFICYWVLILFGLPFWLAFVLALIFAALLGLVINRLVARPLHGAPVWASVMALLGVLIVINGICSNLWRDRCPIIFPSFLPATPVHIGGASISPTTIGMLGIAVVITLAFLAFFKYTKLGLAMRMTALDSTAAQVMGVNIRRIGDQVWMISSVIGAIGGIFFAPLFFLEVDMMAPVLLKGCIAAIVGGFTSITGALVGGLVIGLLEAYVCAYISPGIRDATVLVLLIIVLLVRPAGIFAVWYKRRV